MEGVVDLGFHVVERGQGLTGVDHPRPSGGELLESEVLAVVEQDRRGRLVYVEDETGAGHQRWSLVRAVDSVGEGSVPVTAAGPLDGNEEREDDVRRSNTTLTAPRGPAVAAWSMASR